MHSLNTNYNEIFQLPPAFSQQWDPRSLQSPMYAPAFIEVFPNPADYMVNFHIYCPVEIVETTHLIISDITGRIICETDVFHNSQQLVMDTRNWSSGIYLYELQLPLLGKQSGSFDIQH